MANATATVVIVKDVWTQLVAAGEVAIVSPKIQNLKFIIRYAAADPTVAVKTGHPFYKKAESISFTVGSANTEAAWIMPIGATANVNADVTKI